jgi:hypothetical protein
VGEKLSVDPHQIRRSSSGVQTSGAGLRAKFQSFQAKMAGYGEPWGNDDVGFAIGTIYQAASELAFDCYGSQLGGLDELSGGATAMAVGYQNAEDNSDVEVNHVRDVLG